MNQKAGSLTKINKIDKPLRNLTKIRREKKHKLVKSEKEMGKKKHQGNPGNHQGLL
jgi:hypothetical protein